MPASDEHFATISDQATAPATAAIEPSFGSLPPLGSSTSADDAICGTHSHPLPPSHRDYAAVRPIIVGLFRHAGGTCETFVRKTAVLVRQGIDEVIRTAITNRFTLEEAEKGEKAYLGVNIENLLRNMLGLERGKLDLDLDGTAVDVKHTMHGNWAIPKEALGHFCVLISENERKAIFSIGVIKVHNSYLHEKGNQDGKRGFSAKGKENIWWIAKDHPYPPNPWEIIPVAIRKTIMAGNGGAIRVAALFEQLLDKPLSRILIEHVAQQKDPLRRVRRGGSARDSLAEKGIAILHGGYDRELIVKLKLPETKANEFISHKAANDDEAALLRSAGKL